MHMLKVAMLGLSGSGKTTYLASMFRALSVPSPGIGFYMECDNDYQRRELNSLYRKLVTPNEKIPKTQFSERVITRSFTFCVRKDATVFSALRIEYADDAGELLDNLEIDNQFFIDYINSFDVVLAVISGQKNI